MAYLIKETTREEREKIVAESLGNIEANCDGCMPGLAETLMGKKNSERSIWSLMQGISKEKICRADTDASTSRQNRRRK